MSRLSPAIYWRRRLLVLAAVFLVCWVVTRVVTSGGGGDETVVAPTASPSPTSGATPTPSPSASAAVEGSGTTNVALTTGTKACDRTMVRLQPSVPAGQEAGKDVEIDFVVSTTDTKACTLTPSAKDILVVVSSNDRAVWDSAVCESAVLDGPVTLTPGWTTLARATWSGRGSGTACSSQEGRASAGTYVVRAAMLGGEPSQTTFKLAPPPGPTPEEIAAKKKAEAEKKAKEKAAEKKKADEKKKAEQKKKEAEKAEDDTKPDDEKSAGPGQD